MKSSWIIPFIITLSINLIHAQNNLSSPPNIVYILVDDLGYGDVNFQKEELDQFKNPFIKTPQLTKLAEESLVFTNHYAASPVCSPSRAGLLTGRVPSRANINLYINDLKDDDKYFLSGNEITIPELLKQKGYQTAIFGKWHLNGADWEKAENWTGWTGSFPKQQGFDYGMVCKEDPHFTRVLRVNTQKHPGDFFSIDGKPLGVQKGYSSDIITNAAIEWVKNRPDKKQPFFLYLPYDAVHIRIAAADRFEELYDTGDARRDAYYANITHLDDAIGNFVAALDEMGLGDNTIIFFSSDNGPDVWRNWDATYFCYGTSYPLKGQKYQLLEGGIRVPGMVRWKGKIQAGISDYPNVTYDVLPTLCELADVSLPRDRTFDGISILNHLLTGDTREREKPMFWQFDFPRSYKSEAGENYERKIDGKSIIRDKKLQPRTLVRKGDYVLLGLSEKEFALPTEFELYNIKEDLEQNNDLSALKPDLVEDLKKTLLENYNSVNKDREKAQRFIENGK